MDTPKRKTKKERELIQQGFYSHLKENYEFHKDEKGELYITDKKPLRPQVKRGEWLTPLEVMKKEAEALRLIEK